MSTKKQSRKKWEQFMFSQHKMSCIDYVKSHNITLVAVCYDVVTLKIHGVWQK